jgi:hypothetical protein
MRTHRVDATILPAEQLLALALGGTPAEQFSARTVPPATGEQARALAGTWHNADSTVRLHLAEDWSYAGSVSGRDRCAKGTYQADGTGLLLRDETGLRTPVTVFEHGLEMAGHHLFRTQPKLSEVDAMLSA